MAPLEIVALDALPTGAAVHGAVSGGIKAADIKRIGMLGIDGQIVDVLRLGEEGLATSCRRRLRRRRRRPWSAVSPSSPHAVR